MTYSWEIRARVQFEGDAHVQEDTCGFAGDTAWVVDGATTLLEPLGLPAASDPQWLAQTLSVLLAQPLPAPEGFVGVRARLASALAGVDAIGMAMVGQERVRFPSAAVSVVRLNEDGVEVASLADCRVLVRLEDGRTELVMAQDADAAVDAATVPGGPVDPQDRLLVLGKDRERRNTPGNLWVARREPEAADHAHVVQLPRPALMVLATDGAWRAVDLGLVASPAEFLDRVATPLGALELMVELRREQGRIGEVADDATILALVPAAK
ncbi:hypothetical protein ACQCSX_19360 [Pseudarthrobacter sp. P1]|uniref:hypothetical protein n=1 Tax=Pseudarthrobacter sp. P1 TaxID=3418418 RepID=UPI003CE7B971